VSGLHGAYIYDDEHTSDTNNRFNHLRYIG